LFTLAHELAPAVELHIGTIKLISYNGMAENHENHFTACQALREY